MQFSIIITTHNRPQLLTRCVASVLDQTAPQEQFEIIVVDDGSRPAMARALAPYRNRIIYLYQSQQGWGAARCAGVQHSRGDIVAFLDDDCIAPPTWLDRYERAYAEHPDADGIGGSLRPAQPMNLAGHKLYRGHCAYFNRLNAPLGTTFDRAGRVWFTFGGNRSFRRSVWLSTQPKHTHAQGAWYFDDTLIDLALREQDARIYYEPDAWVQHHYVLSVPQRIRAAYRYGRSEHRVPSRDMPIQPHSQPLTPWGKWRRLKADYPSHSFLEHGWYAITQPLVWFARWWGRRTV